MSQNVMKSSGGAFLRFLVGIVLLTVVPAWAGGEVSSLPVGHPDRIALEAALDHAAADFAIPAEILKAVAFVESRWVQAGPTIDSGWGIMHLVDNEDARTLSDAATISGIPVELIKTDAVANIRAGATLMADLVRRTVGVAVTLQDYRPALQVFTGLSPRIRDKQVDEYYRVLAEGAHAVNGLAMSIDLWPSQIPTGAGPMAQTSSVPVVMSTDYGPAIWNPAANSNYSTGRGGTTIDRWINHWICGSYAGAISWFQNSSSKVSAHFVVRQSDGELTQMVRIADTAYHAGNWNYNQRSIGIEHEAGPSYSWPTSPSAPMLIVSADACRYFCDLYGIPKTRTYIMGHKEVPGVATDCPGPLPWDVYMALVNNTTPTILQSPFPANVCPGATATFTVQAIGSGTLSYQWQKNGANLTDDGVYSGCRTARLDIIGVKSAHAGSYRCVVSNANGSATSGSAVLTLLAATTITQQPVSQRIASGGVAVFSVTATGYDIYGYQWRRYGVDLNDDGRITGSTTATLRIANVGPADVATYSCMVSGGCNSTLSMPASLSLNGVPGDFDGDGDVDMDDFGRFQRCLSGPGVLQDSPVCASAHLEGTDGDVDGQDLVKFVGCLSGSGMTGNIDCLD